MQIEIEILYILSNPGLQKKVFPMIGNIRIKRPVLHEKTVNMEVGDTSRTNVPMRKKKPGRGNGEARPKSFIKSIFSRSKSTKSQDESTPAQEEPKKKSGSKRRLASDRAARSGIMWNEGVEPVSDMISDTAQTLINSPEIRGMSAEHSQHPLAQALASSPPPATEGAVLVTPNRNHSIHSTSGLNRENPLLEVPPSDSDPRRRSTSTSSPIPELRIVDSTGSVENTEIDSKPAQKSSKKGIRRGSGAPSPGKKHLSFSPSLTGGKTSSALNSLGESKNTPPMGHRKTSFSEDVLLALGMERPRAFSTYSMYDDEGFCIDGWHSDDDSLEEFSDEDLQDSENEDSVDGPSTAFIGDIGGGGEGHKLRTIDESKAIPKFQRVAMEILSTENTYVKRLSMLESLRRKLKDSNALSDDALDNIFVNLPSLLTFHKEKLLPELQKRIDKWDKQQRIGDVMKEFAPFLKLYTPFVKNIENARKTLGSLKKSPKAGVVITDFEKSSESARIPMADYLTEPMTRLLRYKLLLGEYLRKLPEDHMDKKSTEEALDNISEIATHVNESLRAENDNLAKIVQIKDSLQGDIDLVQPHRTFLKEGRIAMVNRAKGRHLETHIYLFSDLLLVCQPPVLGAKYKIHKKLPIKGLKVERDDDNHFTVACRTAVIDFFGSTQREANEWETSFRDVINKYKDKHTPAPNEAEVELEVEEELGYRAPHLVRKDTVNKCSQCCLGFKSLRRPKHHCFACGQLFCPRCSNRSLPLAYENWQSRRVCDRCFSSLRDDAVCKSIEDLSRDDWAYGDLLPRELHYSDL